VDDPDFHLNPKNFKRRETLDGGVNLKPPNSVPDE